MGSRQTRQEHVPNVGRRMSLGFMVVCPNFACSAETHRHRQTARAVCCQADAGARHLLGGALGYLPGALLEGRSSAPHDREPEGSQVARRTLLLEEDGAIYTNIHPNKHTMRQTSMVHIVNKKNKYDDRLTRTFSKPFLVQPPRPVRVPVVMEDDFEWAAAVLEVAPPAGEEVGPEGDDGQAIDAAFDLAAGILARPAPKRLGFQRRTPAVTAYARQCKQTKKALEQKATAEEKLKTLSERLCLSCVDSTW